jgi:hypothetical protein
MAPTTTPTTPTTPKACATHVGPIIQPCARCRQPWLAHAWGPGDAAFARAHVIDVDADDPPDDGPRGVQGGTDFDGRDGCIEESAPARDPRATYRITIQPTGEQRHVWATSVEDAAAIMARVYDRRAVAHRHTGAAGGSGVFAAYRYDRQLQASNAIGSEYHVMAVTASRP